VAKLYAGTSGYSYPTWKPDFYPEKLPAKKFLGYYATRLNAVEINYTYHQLPKPATIESWLEETPDGFCFVCKAHQRITHIQRLAPGEFLQVFFKSIDPLRIKGRLGPVLFQLPPNLKIDVPRLTAFLAALPPDVRAAFEFRNESWLVDEVYDLLARHNAALCLAESDKLVIPRRFTADFTYFRLRKAEYPPEARAEVAQQAAALLAQNKDVYVFFKHEDDPAGAKYAEELMSLAHRY
jgi:uncharacterized protein YecE (DUF72 family)